MRSNISWRAVLVLSVAVTVLGLAACPAAWGAVPVGITNAGFENPVLGVGAWQGTIPAWGQGWYNLGAPDPTAWVVVGLGGEAGVYHVSTGEYTSGTAPEGLNMAYVDGYAGYDYGINQVLLGATSKLQADATYVLSATVGNPYLYNEGLAPNYRIELVAGGTVLASATGASPADDLSWATPSLTYNSGAAPAKLGQQLEIRLIAVNDARNDGYEVDFDAVTLNATYAHPISDPDGAYTVVINTGSLSLNGSGSLPSDGSSLSLYEWDLDNDGTYGDVMGATPAAINYATLTGTWGMALGNNTVGLRVTDGTTAETASGITIVTLLAQETFTWTKVATGGLWSDTANWGGLVAASGADNTADFSTLNITAANTVRLDSPVTIGNLIFGDTVASHDWTLDNNGNAANILTLAGTTPTITTNRSVTISAVIAGTSGLTKFGNGTLTLSGTNTYSGGITVNSGTLDVRSAGALGDTGNVVTFAGNSTFTSNNVNFTIPQGFAVNNGVTVAWSFGSNNTDQIVNGPLTGSGTLNVGQTKGVRFLSTANTFTGAINLSSGMYGGRIEFNSLADSANPGEGKISFNQTGYGATVFTWGAGAVSPLTLNNRQFDIGSAGYSSTIQNNNTDTSNIITINSDFLSSPTGTKTLVLGGVNTGDNLIAGAIPNGTGVVTLTKAGTGTWILSGDNTYTGGTTVSGGILKANAAGALSTGNVTVTSGTLVIDVEAAKADTASLYLPSATTKNLTMNADQAVVALFLGGVQQPNNIYNSSDLGSAWMNAGIGNLMVGSLATQPLYWDLNGTDPNACVGGGNTAAGTWDAATANWNNAADGTGATTAWSQGRTATFAAGTDATGDYTVTVDGTRDISGLTFEEGNVTLSGGTALRLTANSLAYVNTGLTATISTPISEDATPRSLTKGGAGTLVLAAANTYTGATTVGQGTLQLSHADAIGGASGNLNVQGGGVVADTTVNLSSLTFTGANNTNVSGGTLAFGTGGSINQTVINQQHTITSAITGSPTVNIAFNGNKSYPGGVPVYQGLTFAPTSGTVTLGIANVPPLNAGGDKAALWLGGTTTGNSVEAVQFIGSSNRYGSLWKKDAGTWTVGNVDIGTCVIDGGTLVVNGTLKVYYTGFSLQSGGTLAGMGTISPALSVPTGAAIAPGDPAVAGGVGTLKAITNVTMNDGSKYEWQIGNGVTDTVNITAGTLDLNNFKLKILDAGGSVSSGTQLPVFTYAATGVTIDMTGFGNAPANFDTTALDLGTWTIGTLALTDDGAGMIYLTGLSTGLAGDTDGNGVVDAADFITLKKNFNTSTGAEAAAGDFDKSGRVDWTDLSTLMGNMGVPEKAPATTPEPCSAMLLVFGAAALLRRRRK